MISDTRIREVAAKKDGPCLLCGNIDASPQRISQEASFTENNVESFCHDCVIDMRRPRSPALQLLRQWVHAHDRMYALIGDDVQWMWENGRPA